MAGGTIELALHVGGVKVSTGLLGCMRREIKRAARELDIRVIDKGVHIELMHLIVAELVWQRIDEAGIAARVSKARLIRYNRAAGHTRALRAIDKEVNGHWRGRTRRILRFARDLPQKGGALGDSVLVCGYTSAAKGWFTSAPGDARAAGIRCRRWCWCRCWRGIAAVAIRVICIGDDTFLDGFSRLR